MWLVFLLGIGKEIFDSCNGGIVDFWDVIATIVGGITMWLLLP